MTFRRTKIAGLSFTAVGGLVVGIAAHYMSTPGWLPVADRSDLLWTGLSCAIGANASAFGLILLIAGLREVPIGAGSRARRGIVVKMSGVNLMLAGLAAITVGEQLVPADTWLAGALLMGFIVVLRFGIVLLRTGWKYDALSAERVLALDPRPPVIYLRSFSQDDQLMITAGGRVARMLQPISQFAMQLWVMVAGPEQELAAILNRVGPVIAIGKPGEPLPELGAARLYVSDDRWRTTVDDYLKQSALVLIRAGTTPNLWWEIEEAMKLVPRQRILIVSLLDRDSSAAFDRAFDERFGSARRLEAPPDAPWLRALKRVSRYRNAPWRIVFFGDDGQPRDVPVSFVITPRGFLMSIGRPYYDILTVAMKRVFSAQSRPWQTPRVHMVAVLLALFGGIVGLHHFYLGDRRRGWRDVRFCWSLVPAVRGWIDGGRLAMMERGEFARRFAGDAFARRAADV